MAFPSWRRSWEQVPEADVQCRWGQERTCVRAGSRHIGQAAASLREQATQEDHTHPRPEGAEFSPPGPPHPEDTAPAPRNGRSARLARAQPGEASGGRREQGVSRRWPGLCHQPGHNAPAAVPPARLLASLRVHTGP